MSTMNTTMTNNSNDSNVNDTINDSNVNDTINEIYCSPLTKEAFEPKQQLRCLFCRGKRCKNCGENAYLNQANPAIPGIIIIILNKR